MGCATCGHSRYLHSHYHISKPKTTTLVCNGAYDRPCEFTCMQYINAYANSVATNGVRRGAHQEASPNGVVSSATQLLAIKALTQIAEVEKLIYNSEYTREEKAHILLHLNAAKDTLKRV